MHIMPGKLGWESDVRSCIIPGLCLYIYTFDFNFHAFGMVNKIIIFYCSLIVFN